MPHLNAKARNALPNSAFAGPGRSYPMPDKSHAANGKARASEMYHKGRISKGTRDKIFAKASKVLSQ